MRHDDVQVEERHLHTGIRVHSGRRTTITIRRARIHVALRLFDAFGSVPLRNLPYELQSSLRASLAGETDADGCLRHVSLPLADYTLSLPHVAGRRVELGVPWLADPDELVDLAVPEVGVARLFVQLLDRSGRRPIANRQCTVLGGGLSFVARTDARGVLSHHPVPLAEYTIRLGGGAISVPALASGADEPYLQAVPWARVQGDGRLLAT